MKTDQIKRDVKQLPISRYYKQKDLLGKLMLLAKRPRLLLIQHKRNLGRLRSFPLVAHSTSSFLN